MQSTETTLPGVLIIEPRVFNDPRGFFFESYNLQRFEGLGISNQFVQDNHSRSVRGTLRGLHYQLQHPQAKLCRVVQGEVLDIVVDIRFGSPTFGRWVSVLLSAENKREIFVPAGYAHGFAVISETAEFLYKCDDFYFPGDEHGVAWDDPAIGIDWQISDPILSEKDRKNPALGEIPESRLPSYTP